jgi:hypothetical protein
MENAEPVTACNEHHTFLLVATKLKVLMWNYLPSSFLNAAITSSVTSAWLLIPCILLGPSTAGCLNAPQHLLGTVSPRLAEHKIICYLPQLLP